MNTDVIREIISYYAGQGAPQDQQMLIALLRETQEETGGVLSQAVIEEIAQALGMKPTMLLALIKRVPSLRIESAAHRLEICGTCRAGARLRDDIERTYGVKSGAVCEAAGFSYHVTSCMKNCKNGPSIKWDGVLHSHADIGLVHALISGQK
ncbi:MAG: NAD(P)H-dependent oxidoreductase subunit E [Clostridia bacterium]|nr:NAD(P)H-dependent oxidoreductase subunit E [Clostridia bacterium]